jgi:AcrR family transcriptional regulator
MTRQAQTVRSERTREALRKAAIVRFLAQGVEDTSAEQIAADAGVTLRTFYRHFASKHDLLFADFDEGLHWFRQALAARPASEPVVESVQAAIFAFPYDVSAVTQIASMRTDELDPGRIVRHMREVEAAFADAVADHLSRRTPADQSDQAGRLGRLEIAITARCIAAAVFAAMDDWMLRDERTLADLAAACHEALISVEFKFRHD